MEDRSKEYESELLVVIDDKEIAFLDHAFAFTTFSKGTAYNHKLHELDTIKEALGKNRVSGKQYMLSKWIKSDNPTLQLAAYRLLSDPEEHKLLNQSYIQQDINNNMNVTWNEQKTYETDTKTDSGN